MKKLFNNQILSALLKAQGFAVSEANPMGLITFEMKKVDSVLTYLKYFRQEAEARSKELVEMMPYQLAKYQYKCFEIQKKCKELSTILSEIEAIAIISFLLHCQPEYVSPALKGGLDLMQQFDLEPEFKNSLIRVHNNYFTEMKININNEQQMRACISLILLKINYLQKTKGFQPDLSEKNFVETIKAKVNFIELGLGINIVVSISIKDKDKCQFLSQQQLNPKPQIFILINGKTEQNQVQIIDYRSRIQEDLTISDSKLVKIFDNSDVFCTKSIMNVWALLFLKNMANRITWKSKKKDAKLDDIVDSYIFDASVEVIEKIKQYEEYQHLWQPIVKIDQQVEIKWKDYNPFGTSFLGEVQNSPKSKLICEFDILGFNEVKENQNIWFDAIVMSSKEGIKTVSFQKSTWRIEDDDYNKSKIQEHQYEERADCISKSILNFVRNDFFHNQQGQFMEYSVYNLEDYRDNLIEQQTYTIDVSSLGFLCLYSFQQEFNYLDSQEKSMSPDLNNYWDQLDNTKEIIKSFVELLNSQKSQQNNIQILVQNFELVSCNLQKLFDSGMLESARLHWINNLKEYFFEIGTQIEVILPSQNVPGENSDKYFLNSPDIVVDISLKTAVIYLKNQRNDTLKYLKDQDNQQYQALAHQDRSQQHTSITKILVDPPAQLSLHSDLIWLIKDWNQVLALFFLMNIKSYIFLLDNDPADTTECQISTNRLVMSPIFVLIVEKCKALRIDQSNQLVWNQRQYDISQNLLTELEKDIKNFNSSDRYSFRNNLDYSNQQQQEKNYYHALITPPQNGQSQFIMEFILISSNQSQHTNDQRIFCKEYKVRIATVCMPQMCLYCFRKIIQDSF